MRCPITRRISIILIGVSLAVSSLMILAAFEASPSIVYAQTRGENCGWFSSGDDCHNAEYGYPPSAGCLVCNPGGGDTGGGCAPGCTTFHYPCPNPGETGEQTVELCSDFLCHSSQTIVNTCQPPSCTPSAHTTDLGCANGPGSDLVTTTTNSDCTTSTSENNSCTACPSGTSWNGSTCVAPPPPPPPPSCPTGQHPVNNTCVPNNPSNPDNPSSCPSPTHDDIGCDPGYSGTDILSITYGPPPSCTPSYSYQNNCIATGSAISVSNNTSGSWIINGQTGSGSSSINVNPDPSGTLYTITPSAVTGYDYPPMVTNSVTGAGSSFLLFPGQMGGFSLTYNSLSAAFDYTLSNSGNVTAYKGGYGQSIITKTLSSGSTQPVSLSVSPTIPGVATAVSGGGVCNPTCSNTITFTVDQSAAAGTYPITVTGTPNNHTTSFNLVIQESQTIQVSCSASPSPALVGQPVTWTGSVQGGVPPYTYIWSGTNLPSPTPVTPSFSVTYSTVGVKSATLRVIDSLSNTQVCSPAGTVQINFNPQFKEI